MNKTMKKALSLVLMMIMVISSVPMSGFAANILCNLGHDWGTYTVTTPATCSTKGVETASCKRTGCGETKTREVATVATAHKEVSMPKTAPTCDKNGNEAGIVCALCDVVISGYTKIPATGHKSTALAAKAATCTEDGYTSGTKCSVCDVFLTGGAKVEKTGHNWTIYSQTAPTCEVAGSRTNVCLNCGTKETKEIEATHSFGNWTTVAATCTAAGKKTRSCTVAGCNGKEEVEIPKLGHTEETVTGKAATCLEPGVTAGVRCKVCNTSITGAETIPAKGHTAQVVKGTPATCDKSGTSDSSYCKDCGYVISEAMVIAKLGHKMVKDTTKSKEATCTTTGIYAEKCTNEGCTYATSETLSVVHEANWVTITEVTCTKDGKRRGTCTKCGMDVTETVKAEGHKVYNETLWKTTKAATCTEAGTKSAKCSICGETATQTIPALGHSEVVNTAKKDATCTAKGATESKKCSRCGTITVKSEEIPMLEHTYGEWVVKTSSTCKTVGVKEATCTVCSTKKTETIDKVPHTEEEIPAVAPTCTKAGTTAGKKCTVCQDITVAVTEVAATGHSYVADADAVPATCETAGRDKATCSVCSDKKDVAVDALGHTEQIIPGTAADCETSGLSDGKVCTVCNKVIAEQVRVDALGHDLVVDASKSTPATCTTLGQDFLNCTRCKYTETKDTPALAHNFGEWITTKEPSCAESGEQTRTCANCKTIETQDLASLGGHDVVALPGVEATCTEAGKTAGSYCSRCETIFDAQDEIPAKGHTLSDEPTLTPATVDAAGAYGHKCTVCGSAENGEKIAQIDKASIKLAAAKYYYNGKVITPAVTVKDVDGNDLVKGEDYDVIYSSGRKNPGKYDAQITFKGNYEGEMTLTFSINPVKSAKVSYTNYNDYILISWDKVVGATGYTIYIYKNSESGTTRKALKTVNANTTSYKLTADYNGKALKLDEGYRIGIVSRTRTADDTILTSLNPAMKVVTRKLVKPTLTVTSTTGKATLKWTNIANETGYEVVYSTSKDGTYKSLGTTKVNVVTLTKSLTRGATYYFKVRAYKTVDGEKIYSNYSAVKSVKIK